MAHEPSARTTFLALLLAVVLISMLHTRFLTTLYAIRDPIAANMLHPVNLTGQSLTAPLPPTTPAPTPHRTPLPTPTPTPIPPARPLICTLYDRPAHTACNHITNALSTCLTARGHTTLQMDASSRHLIARNLSKTPLPEIASIHTSLFLTRADVALLRARCRNLVYITSCAPMRLRLWAAAARFATSVNRTLMPRDADSDSAATDWLVRHGREYFRFYEAYPFVRLSGPQVADADTGVTELPDAYEAELASVPDSLTPDFVVREEALASDLPDLLAAFGCRRFFNVSEKAEGRVDDQASPSEIDVREKVLTEILTADGGETVYPRLMALADSANLKGLSRIRRVVGLQVRGGNDLNGTTSVTVGTSSLP